jgi:DHA1 family bicyclomycin/chloramphenicol resistance-like MFS transporter
MIGSALSARWATKFSSLWMIRAGYLCMLAAATISVGYNSLYPAQVPWAVLPLTLYSFGLAIMTPTVTVMALDIFPDNKGLAASLQSFIQMLTFAVISGVVAPLLFDSGLKLALGMVAGLMLSFLCWLASKRVIGAREL